MSERFAGKLVLVLGGTGGLGRAVSTAFLREGATVVVTYRRQDEFEALPALWARMRRGSMGAAPMSPMKRQFSNSSQSLLQSMESWT
jgi:NAD(P)-dependent dehydrogenase (short-subunit alcohol dehydrogenase family)